MSLPNWVNDRFKAYNITSGPDGYSIKTPLGTFGQFTPEQYAQAAAHADRVLNAHTSGQSNYDRNVQALADLRAMSPAERQQVLSQQTFMGALTNEHPVVKTFRSGKNYSDLYRRPEAPVRISRDAIIADRLAGMQGQDFQTALQQGVDAQAGELIKQDYNRRSNSGFRGAFKAAVPLGIGALGAFGAGSALLGGLGKAGAATTGLSAGGSTSTGLGAKLGSALGNFSTNSALSGALQGGISGLVGGGDFGDALKGAALGGVTAGYAPAIASGIGGNLGITSKAGLGALAKGIQGAAIGGIGGGGRGALIGAALGAGGGYLQGGGGIPGLGHMPGASLDEVSGVAGMQGPTRGSGFLGKLGGFTGGSTAGGQPMKLGSLLQAGGDVLGYFNSQDDMDDIERILQQQSSQAQAQFQPYAQAGRQALANMQAPSLEALQNDPGYQFRLQEGQRALENSFAARGLGQSGAALRAAQEYGQGLADQTYNDFFRRQAQMANTGFGAARGLGSIYGGLGSDLAQMQLARANQRNRLFGGLGALAGGLFG